MLRYESSCSFLFNCTEIVTTQMTTTTMESTSTTTNEPVPASTTNNSLYWLLLLIPIMISFTFIIRKCKHMSYRNVSNSESIPLNEIQL
jgi:DMSO reductase anchor subunit